MSQGVEIGIAVHGLAALVAAVAEAGAEIVRERRLKTADGQVHDVDYVVRDQQSGAEVGVVLDAEERATFVPQDCEAGRGKALAGRVAQRWARSRIVEQMRRQGYRLEKEEARRDGTVQMVWQRWR